MDAINTRWRTRAAQQGWKSHAPVAIAAAAVPAAPGGGAAPLSPEALAAAKVPIKSEKLGTAAPSADVKSGPTRTQPRDASPTVQKGSPDVSKK
jgi:colicin import membrane protein